MVPVVNTLTYNILDPLKVLGTPEVATPHSRAPHSNPAGMCDQGMCHVARSELSRNVCSRCTRFDCPNTLHDTPKTWPSPLRDKSGTFLDIVSKHLPMGEN